MMINTFKDLLDEMSSASCDKIYEFIENTEADFLEIKKDDFRLRVKKILDTMKNSVKAGLNSSAPSKSGLCGENTDILKKSFGFSEIEGNGIVSTSSGLGLLSPFQKRVALYTMSVIEENARMGKIAACPTAGSSGIVAGVLTALGDELNLSDEILINALITAGAVGEIISKKMALAGAVGGCQAECGAASSMAAAACTYILGGNNEQILNAASLALKNILGLTCDPVAGLVEVPCVKRNVFMAIHALVASELSMAGVVSKIPIDEVVDAMKETGDLMAGSLKESSEAGLARTKTALGIENILRQKM